MTSGVNTSVARSLAYRPWQVLALLGSAPLPVLSTIHQVNLLWLVIFAFAMSAAVGCRL